MFCLEYRVKKLNKKVHNNSVNTWMNDVNNSQKTQYRWAANIYLKKSSTQWPSVKCKSKLH